MKSFVAKQKEMAYSVAMDSGDVAKAYKVSGIPIAFIIVNGKIVWSGYPWAGLDKAVEAAVADPKKAFEDAVAAGKTKAADKAGDKDND